VNLVRAISGAEYRSGLALPQEWLIDALGGPMSSSGESVTVEKALRVAPFNAGVRLISGAMLSCPLKVYRDVNGEKVNARDHSAWKLLHDAPNPMTPAGRFWETVVAHLLLYGDAFLWKNRTDEVLVDELWIMDPNQLTIEWDASGRRKTFVQQSTGSRRVYTDEEVLHIPAWSLDGLKGRSAVMLCREALGAAMARDQFEGAFYKRGAVFSGFLKSPTRIENDDTVRRLKQRFIGAFQGARDAHGVPLLEEGFDYVQAQTSLREMQFVESQQLTATTIATMLNIPPSYLGGSTGDSLTYGTRESEAIQFVTHGLMPWTSRVEEALAADRSIFPLPSWQPEFVLDGLMRADAKTRAEIYSIMFRVKALLPNEMRALENRSPILGGDTFPEEPPPPEPVVEPSPTEEAAAAI